MVSKQKQELVGKLTAEIKAAPIIGMLNLQNLPAQQLQVMRKQLAQKEVAIVMTRKKLLQRALAQSNKKNIAALAEKIKGMPALLLSRGNPFALYSLIQKSKSEAPAKPGQISPRDIMVRAGPTSFAPGPIISELAAVGIKTKVEAGKLAIIQDTTIVNEGQPISAKVAETLKRLDIRPMEIGLDLVAVWEEGIVFEAKQLHVDEAEYAQRFTVAAQEAMNLAVDVAYPSAETMDLLLQKGFREAKAVGVEAAYLTEETRDEILAKSEREAQVLQEQVPV